jgi:uncharacterized coiled-coil DUF342 family protein
LVGTLFGGIALEFTKRWLAKGSEAREDRKDYRDEIKSLNERIDKLEDDNDEWRAKFWKSQEEITSLKKALLLAGIDVPVTKP